MRLAAASLLLFSAVPLWAGEPPPGTYEVERYTKLMSDSPFALATPTAAPAAPERSFAEGWTVIGLWQEKAEGGTVIEKATIRTSEAKTFTLAGHDPDQDGVSISAVKWSDKPFSSSLTLKKGTEFANVEFIDPAQQSAAPSPPMTVQRPGMPNGQMPRPPITPNSRIQRPIGGGVQQPNNNQPRPNNPRGNTRYIPSPNQ